MKLSIRIGLPARLAAQVRRQVITIRLPWFSEAEIHIVLRECDCECGRVFVPRGTNQRFASAEHRSLWHRKMKPDTPAVL